jgi:hypothetical protein
MEAEKKRQAIACDSERAPHFINIAVYDDCSTQSDSYADFDDSDDSRANNTGLSGNEVSPGGMNFQVESMEVIGITD